MKEEASRHSPVEIRRLSKKRSRAEEKWELRSPSVHVPERGRLCGRGGAADGDSNTVEETDNFLFHFVL